MDKRILVIKPSSLGDIIHTFPALGLLKQLCPDHKLDFVVNPEFVPLLEFSPFPIDRTIIFERKKLAEITSFFPEMVRLIRSLRQKRYDFVIDFQGLLRSAFCAGIARSSCRAGFADPREKSAAFFYDRKFRIEPAHAAERSVRLVEKLFDLPASPIVQPELPISSEGVKNLPELPEKYIVLLPGTRWESKRFPTELFSALVTKLREKMPQMNFVTAGSSNEAHLGKAIGCGVINLAGKTTMQSLFELLRNSCGVIGNDSGPLHAAAALGCPVFGFYGPTDPGLTGPMGGNCMTFSVEAECSGCLKRECPLPSCLCHQLDVDAVAAAVDEKIRRMCEV